MRTHHFRFWPTKVMAVVIVGLLLAFFVHDYLVNRSMEPPANCTLAEFARQAAPPKHLAVVMQNDVPLLVWIGRIPSCTLRSGPPCYVFNEHGRLIDWCLETGEGWSSDNLVAAAFQEQPMSLEEAMHWARGAERMGNSHQTQGE